MSYCPKCLDPNPTKDLDCDKMASLGMYDADNEGVIDCANCGHKIKWHSFSTVAYDFEEIEEEEEVEHKDMFSGCFVCGETLTDDDMDSDSEYASTMCETCRIDMGRE